MTPEPARTPDADATGTGRAARPDQTAADPTDAGVPGPGVAAPQFTAHLAEILDSALREFAAEPAILVALDFDGVLAPLVLDPKTSRILPASAEAVATLTTLPGVAVVLVSGRDAGDLAELADVPVGTRIIGSHGAQWGTIVFSPDGRRVLRADPVDLTEEQASLRAVLIRETEEIAAGGEGAWVQAKPAAAVLHTRRASREDAARLTAATLAGPAAREGVHVVVGKEVVEMAVLTVTKGDALVRLRTELGSDAVLYAGDDTTDEDAFAVLGEGDVSIKVGDGHTGAAYRVADPDEFSAVLVRLAELRADLA
ncbi:MAG: trehalose-phosphatase [Georgenia sp.]